MVKFLNSFVRIGQHPFRLRLTVIRIGVKFLNSLRSLRTSSPASAIDNKIDRESAPPKTVASLSNWSLPRRSCFSGPADQPKKHTSLFSILSSSVKTNHPALQAGIIVFMRAMRESNSRPRFWRPMLYHLTNRPYLFVMRGL